MKVWNATTWVANALDKNEFGVFIDVLSKLLFCFLLSPFHCDPKTREQCFEETVRATVQIDGCYHVVTCPSKTNDGVKDCGLSGGSSYSRSASFQGSSSFLKYGNRWLVQYLSTLRFRGCWQDSMTYVGNPAVKVACLLRGAHSFGMSTIGEYERLEIRVLDDA